MPTNHVIVIAGMGRSGTSLVASVLQNAGVFIGEQLIGPAKGNLRGHFEDRAFNSFQRALLNRRDKIYLVQDLENLKTFSPEEIHEAEELVRARADVPIWGWKDPRSTLFLDFWNERIPHANYIFVYRHPIAVIHSLLRRNSAYEDMDAQAALNAWSLYNQQILEFIEKHPEKCILGNVEQIAQDFSAFISRVNQKFALDLNKNIDDSIFHPDELKRAVYEPPFVDAFSQAAPEATQIFRRLDELADLPPAASTANPAIDQQFSDALECVIRKQLAKEENNAAKLNYLFSLILPGLANNWTIIIKELLRERQKLTSDVQALLAQVGKYDKDTRELLQSIAFQAEANQSLGNSVQSLKNQVDQLTDENRTLAGELALSRNEAAGYALSTSWRITRPLRNKIKYIKHLYVYLKNFQAYRTIRRSNLFDDSFYLQNNPDVRQADMDPLLHFVYTGWREGRSPSAAFNLGQYLKEHPEATASGMNPLLYYMYHEKMG